MIKLRNGKLASASYDTTVKITNIHTGVCEAVLPHNKIVFGLTQLPNDVIVTGGMDSCIRFWDITQEDKEKMLVDKIDHNEQKDCCAIAVLSEEEIACGSYENINIYRIGNKEKLPVRVIEGHSGLVRDLIVLGDGKTLVSSGYDGAVMISDWKLGVPVRKLTDFYNHVTSVSWFGEGLFAICDLGDANKEASIYLCDLVNPPVTKLGQHKMWVSSLSYCANGVFVSYGSDCFVRFWF